MQCVQGLTDVFRNVPSVLHFVDHIVRLPDNVNIRHKRTYHTYLNADELMDNVEQLCKGVYPAIPPAYRGLLLNNPDDEAIYLLLQARYCTQEDECEYFVRRWATMRLVFQRVQRACLEQPSLCISKTKNENLS